jgi:comEA protein
MKQFKQEWFFFLDKLQIRPAERFFVGTLTMLLVLFWTIQPALSGPELFDDDYYKPLIAEFKSQSARNYIAREEVLQNYYPGREDAISSYVVRVLPEKTPLNVRKRILDRVAQYKNESLVVVPELSESEQRLVEIPDTIPTSSTKSVSDKINLNKAGVSELMKLPRVGQATAIRIIAWRDENGGFKRIEDIMKVRGIGARTFEQFVHMIEV